jgi:hypothetical protein
MGSSCSGHVDVLTTLDTDTLERLQREFDEFFSVPLKRRARGQQILFVESWCADHQAHVRTLGSRLQGYFTHKTSPPPIILQ